MCIEIFCETYFAQKKRTSQEIFQNYAPTMRIAAGCGWTAWGCLVPTQRSLRFSRYGPVGHYIEMFVLIPCTLRQRPKVPVRFPPH